MSLPIPRDQGTVPFQVVLVDISIAVPGAVVLVDSPSPIDPQVDPGDEPAPLVEGLLLRGHGISAAWCSARMIDSHADSLRASSMGMTLRSRGAPRRRCRAVIWRSVRVQCRSRSAESPRITRSSTPRSRAAAKIVSAAVVIRSPLTRFIGNGWVWRQTSSPGRRGRGSALSMAAKTGWVMVPGSHQPRSRAAVRCEKAAVRGSTSCHAASSSSWVRLSAGAYTPRVMRSHSRPRSHPRTGERGVSWTVTREASGRGLESCVRPHICGPPAVPAPCCGKPVACSRQLVTHHVKIGATRVGSDRLRHVGNSGRRGGC